jgi:tRNA-splicing ligase RtcB
MGQNGNVPIKAITVYKGAEVPIKAWVRGVPVESEAITQLKNVASMRIIHKHIAVMPDVHFGMGATIGSVIPTKDAIIPAAVGVDIGCGMMADMTGLVESDLPKLKQVRKAIEAVVPRGFAREGSHIQGGWGQRIPKLNQQLWDAHLAETYERIQEKHPGIRKGNDINHLGTLGSGNHFVEVCLDTADRVWIMLHSGSRGVGNRMATYFIRRAKESMDKYRIELPDKNLAYFPKGTSDFDDYLEAAKWAQEFARINRVLMMRAIRDAIRQLPGVPQHRAERVLWGINCHHNYVAYENHFGENVLVTRKGAVRARKGDFGIIPGSMGARSYIVEGKGNPDSFMSCSHGAGRAMSRKKAKEKFSLADHVKATEGVECRKDEGVLDETPAAYKDIDTVMAAQTDLVRVVHTLKQVVCVKG